MTMSTSTATPPEHEMVEVVVAAGHSPNGNMAAREVTDNASVPKPKRLACMICRRRKLKCDGVRPSCSTCSRLGHNCAYDEVRRKSGPKRGYVKALEERLKQVETLLKAQEPNGPSADPSKLSGSLENGSARNQAAASAAGFTVTNPSISIASDRDMDRWQYHGESPQTGNMDEFGFNNSSGGNSIPMGIDNVSSNFTTWEMIGLGLEEPLPTQETIDELHQTYFEKVHPSVPMIHKYRYLAAMNLAPNQRPPVALRYAIWTLACSITDKYSDLKDLFYQRARKYVEADYIKGYGEHMISVAHAQTHVLLASYELKMMYFPRAWMNTGAAVRLCQMIGLHRLDGDGLDVKQCLPPPRDWTEREERRRTFWMAFCKDRYSSIGTGWPMTIEERDIMTNLPASEEAFEMSRPEQTQSLQDAMSPSGASKLSSFGGIVLLACLFGRNLTHLHRPDPDDRDHDVNGEFWKRHRQMDNILLNTSLCLPQHLKLPAGMGNPNIVFTNMSIHTSTICLHQAAIYKADKYKLPASTSSESKVRCLTAANEIASIMRMISHMDLSSINPFISFCLYVAARVFVQYLKSRPDDSQTADSLRFLLSAMNALKRRNPLTESFLVQLDVDLEALGMRIPKLKAAFPRSTDSPGPAFGTPSSTAVRRCENPEGIGGIMAYRNECHFLKTVEDDGNPATGPDIVETDNDGQKGDGSATGFGSQSWISEQQIPSRESTTNRGLPMQSMPVLPSVPGGSMTGFGPSESAADTNDISVSPETQSNRPTPKSSSASEHRPVANGHVNGSGPNSFETSPVSAHQALTSSNGVDGAQQPAYYPDHNGFRISNMTPDQRFPVASTGVSGFEVPWQEDMSSQQGITPVAAGVLRSLMNMEPMDAMDLSSWDSGN